MRVSLIDYTGAGYSNPDRHAANVLIFTKNTRLEMNPYQWNKVSKMDQLQVEEELAYMARTLPSSWEFVHYTFLIQGVTRAFTHQLVRTRTGSYAQQAMRIAKMDQFEYEAGPTIKSDPGREEIYDLAMKKIQVGYDALLESGTAIEDARGVLPTNILTNIVASFNMRTLADLFRKRASTRVQDEYRHVIAQMRIAVERVHPFTKLFFERNLDVAAKELEEEIGKLGLDEHRRLQLVKLIDQIRTLD